MYLQQNYPLKSISNYKIGGPAKYFAEFKNLDELKKALGEYKKIDPELKSVLILGSATNVLIKEEGFNGLVLKNSIKKIDLTGNVIKLGAGTLMSELVDFAGEKSITGFEWAGGLPGTVGGAVRGNAGAFGGEIKDNLLGVESINFKNFEIKERITSECLFSYRNSIFKTDEGKNEIIISAKFSAIKGDGSEIKSKSNENKEYRRVRHPIEYPNLGSTFKNISVEKVPNEILQGFIHSVKHDPFPVLPVAKLLASTDLVGKKVGGAQISTKHPNFIINTGGATSHDVLELINIVKKEFIEKYKVSLEEEITIL